VPALRDDGKANGSGAKLVQQWRLVLTRP